MPKHAVLSRLFVLLTIPVLAVALPILPSRAGGWEMVFSDEFNGDALDRNKWATRYLYQNETMDHFTDESQRYRDSQVTVAGGVLNLRAEKKPGADLFESGLIRSHRTFYYGYYEARVFLPSGKGVFPAFWLEADYDQDGKFWHPPEIDIFEYVINGTTDKPNMLHSSSTPPGLPQPFTFVDPSFRTDFRIMVGKDDLNRDWHVAGFVWTPDTISLFWDGRRIYTRKYEWQRKDGQLGPPAHIDLNFAVGGTKWAGKNGVDDAAFPQDFKVDYVRVCQFTESSRGSRQCGDSKFTPDPAEFGYAAAINDMPKPSFTKNTLINGRRPEVGEITAADLSTGIEVSIALKLPEGYPTDKTLLVAAVDKNTGTTAASASRKLDERAFTVRPDGSSSVGVSLPAIRRPGSYRLEARLTADVSDEKGKRYSSAAPLECDTPIAQPLKSRSCQLATFEVR
ncbi:glycoside hydrolase family 16 protein [Bradyrhizobium commune]|uniref:Glycoside hydrolase family 16 protein n=1 Tax=Bradyrhizobium commune TaxID=83627 RepID=A0A7S9GY72_9BRAD|nr:glycoside hydrolase family 16 protein [Bradyrhizobium commune]QPF90269.1 glycoside hydrolase family 16 protein [Bradyrhizobium commune]